METSLTNNNNTKSNTNDNSTLSEAKEYLNKTSNEEINSPFIERPTNKFNPDDYVVLKQIGWGNFSDIYLVESKKNKQLSVMKTFEVNKVERMKKQRDVLMEKHVMHKVGAHENIIKYYSSFKDNFYLYLNYEYINGGDLWSRCIYYGLPSLNMIKNFFKQVLLGIKKLHDNNIIHRDIKPENILVSKENNIIKIIDFGSCKDVEGTEFERDMKSRKEKQEVNGKRKGRPEFEHYVGTPNYMAPECVHNKESTFKSDSFSLGCLLYQLYFGFPPFTGKSEYLIYLKSTKCEYSIYENLIDNEGHEIIKNLINTDPKSRYSVDDLLQHKYFETIEDNSNENNNNNSDTYIKPNQSFTNNSLFNASDKEVLEQIIKILYSNTNSENDLLSNQIYQELLNKTTKELKEYCSLSEIYYKTIIEKIREDYKQAKEYSTTLEELKRSIQFSKENKESIKEDVYNKLELITIHLTNFETEFSYLFTSIFSILRERENKTSVYLDSKIKHLRKQLLYELFNQEEELNKENIELLKKVQDDYYLSKEKKDRKESQQSQNSIDSDGEENSKTKNINNDKTNKDDKDNKVIKEMNEDNDNDENNDS